MGSTGTLEAKTARAEGRRLAPVAEPLKAIHEGLGLGSGSLEHRRRLDQATEKSSLDSFPTEDIPSIPSSLRAPRT